MWLVMSLCHQLFVFSIWRYKLSSSEWRHSTVEELLPRMCKGLSIAKSNAYKQAKSEQIGLFIFFRAACLLKLSYWEFTEHQTLKGHMPYSLKNTQ